MHTRNLHNNFFCSILFNNLTDIPHYEMHAFATLLCYIIELTDVTIIAHNTEFKNLFIKWSLTILISLIGEKDFLSDIKCTRHFRITYIPPEIK